jgi:hypothetical protein
MFVNIKCNNIKLQVTLTFVWVVFDTSLCLIMCKNYTKSEDWNKHNLRYHSDKAVTWRKYVEMTLWTWPVIQYQIKNQYGFFSGKTILFHILQWKENRNLDTTLTRLSYTENMQTLPCDFDIWGINDKINTGLRLLVSKKNYYQWRLRDMQNLQQHSHKEIKLRKCKRDLDLLGIDWKTISVFL